MVTYGAKELTHVTWGKWIKEYHVKQNIGKTHSQFQNKAETLIKEIR